MIEIERLWDVERVALAHAERCRELVAQFRTIDTSRHDIADEALQILEDLHASCMAALNLAETCVTVAAIEVQRLTHHAILALSHATAPAAPPPRSRRLPEH